VPPRASYPASAGDIALALLTLQGWLPRQAQEISPWHLTSPGGVSGARAISAALAGVVELVRHATPSATYLPPNSRAQYMDMEGAG